jgi:hypothetical protein
MKMTLAHVTVQKKFIILFYSYSTPSFFNEKVKVKVTLVQTLRLCTGCTAHRGSRGVTLLFLDHGTRRG